MHDIIPDIHGHSSKLAHALDRLGYRHRRGAWRHDEPGRSCVFLGDFIDRGPDNAGVIRIVRDMIEAGTAVAVMGNHELNAIHFHTTDPATGAPLRPHSAKNLRQHASFLAEFPVGDARTAETIAWMRSLPLFLERDGFRAVHACWTDRHIARLADAAAGGVLTEDDLIRAANPADPLHAPVMTTTKGPETDLPDGHRFTDKDGTRRGEVRLKWWEVGAATWPEIAISVPDPAEFPAGALPDHMAADIYPAAAKPVFFGHYWLMGAPVMQAPNALCLDYSAGLDGPLVSYLHRPGRPLDLAHLAIHGP